MRLALVFHQHQPAGNFPSVFQEVTERAYAPLVATLYRHPEVKASLHFSGPLLDWLEANRPDVIGDLADLVRRGQIEVGEVADDVRSEEHTSELQSPCNLVCRLLLEKKKKHQKWVM